MRSRTLFAFASLCLFALPACDDGDSDSKTAPFVCPDPEPGAALASCDPMLGTTPTLSNLVINTDVSALAVGESTGIDGTLTVTDPDGDVDQLRITVNLPDGSSQDLPTTSVAGADGNTAFSMQLQMVVRPPVAGEYRVDVRMDDDQGNLSTPVSFTLTAE